MRILVVDDHPLVRKGLASILSLEKDVEAVFEASAVEEAIEIIRNNNPEQALIDLRLGEQSGLDIIKRIGRKLSACRFIILTSSPCESDFRDAESLGVDGYILKDAYPDEILYAVRLIGRGRKYYDPAIMDIIMKKDEYGACYALTDREREVLSALGMGLSNKDIAKKLYITEYTVKKHVSNILEKLDLDDRTQAALYANNKGIARY